MYSKESISKAVFKLNDKIKAYSAMIEAGEFVPCCISKGNRKIGHVLNVSTAPIITCGHACKHCMGICYDIKAVLQYANVVDARARNTALAMKNRLEYFKQIRAALKPRRKNKMFRWHVAGDILDEAYLSGMINIAWENPDWIFWTYSKQYAIVNEYVRKFGGKEAAIPSNLTIMFSEWDGLEMANPYDFPVFSCVLDKWSDVQKELVRQGKWHCPGNCDICKVAKRGCPYGESCWVNEH